MKQIVWLKGTVAFLIPFFTVLGASLAPYALDGAKSPSIIAWLIIWAATMVASLSGLGSFLSTTFADHKAELAAQNPPPPDAGTTGLK